MKHIPILLVLGAAFLFYNAKHPINGPNGPNDINTAQNINTFSQKQLIREHVIELPEDGLKWETIIVSDQKTPQEVSLVAAFNTDERLISLVAQTKLYILPTNHWWVQSRLPSQPTPMVIVQKPRTDQSGATRVYHVTGSNIPTSSTVLAEEIQWSIDGAATLTGDCKPNQPCPLTPTPTPVQPGPAPLPDIRPQNTPFVTDDNIGYILLAAAGVAGAYMGYSGGKTQQS